MDEQELLRKILHNPETAHFSKLKYANRPTTSLEDKVSFLNGLFNTAVEAKYTNDWDSLDKFLDQWEDKIMTASAGRSASRLEGDYAWTPFTKPLSQATVAVLTTGGFYEPDQEPYDIKNPDGDWTFRPIHKSTPTSSLLVTHPAYDIEGPRQDPNCVFPLDPLKEMEAEGVIGKMADTNYSFMGFIRRPDLLVSDTATQVAQLLKGDGVDAAVLTST
ncbi:MAG: glycine/sarcosine/betaine reductase selenoprotein B family protein [Dehalococcoidia bacterium]|nr:glycine/sarcosine/betaine reductase selenoprotein B family protein [Chloroflexota bacterium]